MKNVNAGKKKYIVFISSTYVDLQDERQEIYSAVNKMGCIPTGMEWFPAADVQAFDLIKAEIDECDYYVLLIGGRYGSIDQNTGLSFTEMEYDYAVSKGVSVIALVHKEPENLPSKNVDQDVNIKKKLEDFKTKIKSRHINYWKQRQDIAPAVMAGLKWSMEHQPSSGWVRNGLDPSVLSNRPAVYNRDEMQTSLPSMEQRLADARTQILISGNDCKFISSVTPSLEDALKRGVSVRIMCVAPASAGAKMLPKIDPRFPDEKFFNDEVRSSIKSINQFNKYTSSGLFQMRQISILPALGFFITDRNSNDGITKVEIYAAKPFNSRPHLIFGPEQPQWRSFFHVQWENYWNLAVPV